MPPYASRRVDRYPRLREVLAPEYAELPAEQIESLMERTFGPGPTAADYESIFDNIWGAAKSVGGAIGHVAQQAAPYVGPALKGAASGAMAGSALGPWGMLGGALVGGTGGALASSGKGPAHDIGGAINTGLGMAGSFGGGRGLGALGNIGGILGQLTGGAGGVPGPGAAPPIGAALPSAATGSPAAGQLLNLLAQPQFQQALMAMMMGSLGRQNVQVGSTPVPVGAFSNLLGMLANRASAESNAMQLADSEAVPEYLTSEGGQFHCDIANPEARATVLWELLQENYRAELESDADEDEGADESMNEDAFYDALDLAEMDLELEEVED